jgi:cardiolipin synthase
MAVASSGRAVGRGILSRALQAIRFVGGYHAANLLSLVRLLSTVPLVLLILGGRPADALVLFVAAGFTDAFDGFIAKRFNTTTRFGAMLDPLADKLLVGFMILALAVIQAVPLWLALGVIARDVLLGVGTAMAVGQRRQFRIEPLVIGKASTLFQFAYLAAALAALAGLPLAAFFQWLLLPVVAGVTFASAVAYIVLGADLFRPGRPRA